MAECSQGLRVEWFIHNFGFLFPSFDVVAELDINVLPFTYTSSHILFSQTLTNTCTSSAIILIPLSLFRLVQFIAESPVSQYQGQARAAEYSPFLCNSQQRTQMHNINKKNKYTNKSKMVRHLQPRNKKHIRTETNEIAMRSLALSPFGGYSKNTLSVCVLLLLCYMSSMFT